MKSLVFNVFGNDQSKNENKIQKMSSCRGWCKITLTRMSSCRGWCKITLCRI